jgi:hypothetical protein
VLPDLPGAKAGPIQLIRTNIGAERVDEGKLVSIRRVEAEPYLENEL